MRWFAFLLCAVACGAPNEGPEMQAGADCISCHTGSVAEQWTVAGTLYESPDAAPDAGLSGAQILVTDSTGKSLTLLTNGAGNFFTNEALKPPLKVQAQFGNKRMAMGAQPMGGACNHCHAQPAQYDAPGRIFVPR